MQRAQAAGRVERRDAPLRAMAVAEAPAGFGRETPPLGAALLRYVNLRNVGLAVPVAETLAAVVGGDPALPEKARAVWKVTPPPVGEDPATKAKPSPLSRAFAVASLPVGAKPVEVGQLLLRIDAPAVAVTPVKPAAK